MYDTGRKLFTRDFLVIVNKSAVPLSRLGITISRKIDKRAVVRNSLKRKVREIFRHFRSRLKSSIDIVVVARKGAPNCSYSEMKRQIWGTLQYNGYFDNSQGKNIVCNRNKSA